MVDVILRLSAQMRYPDALAYWREPQHVSLETLRTPDTVYFKSSSNESWLYVLELRLYPVKGPL